jgi:hypothetical protein
VKGLKKMSQTMRRELRTAFEEILHRVFNSQTKTYEVESISELLADAALQVAGIVKHEPPQSLEWLIASGASGEVIDKLLQKEKIAKEATDCFERSLVVNPLPWDKDSKWRRFKNFVIEEHQKDPGAFKRFKVMRDADGKYSKLPSNGRIYDDPDLLIAIWPSLFVKKESVEKKEFLL